MNFPVEGRERNWDREREGNKDHNKTLTQNFVSLNLAVRPSAGFTYALYPFVPWFFCLNHYQQEAFWIILISVVLFAKTRCLCYRWYLLAKEHLSQRSVPSALQVPSGQIMHGLPVTSESALGEPWRHLWAFCMFYRRFWAQAPFPVYVFWMVFIPLSLFESWRPKDIQLQPQVTEKQPQNPGSWLRYRLSISCWTSTAQGRKKQHCHLSGKIWGLWIRRDESIWRMNEKNVDLQNYTCAA